MATIVDRIADLVSRHNGRIRRRQGIQAKHAAAAAARAKALEVAEREAARIRAILEAPDRLRHEAYGAGLAEDRELGTIDREILDNPTRELERFTALVERLAARARTASPPEEDIVFNEISNTVVVRNADERERHRVAVSGPLDPARPGHRQPSAIRRAQDALRNELPWLDADQQRARIAELRDALETALAETALAAELA
jgi:hypothetical protein